MRISACVGLAAFLAASGPSLAATYDLAFYDTASHTGPKTNFYDLVQYGTGTLTIADSAVASNAYVTFGSPDLISFDFKLTGTSQLYQWTYGTDILRQERNDTYGIKFGDSGLPQHFYAVNGQTGFPYSANSGAGFWDTAYDVPVASRPFFHMSPTVETNLPVYLTEDYGSLKKGSIVVRGSSRPFSYNYLDRVSFRGLGLSEPRNSWSGYMTFSLRSDSGGGSGDGDQPPTAPVPLPGAAPAMLIALGAFLGIARRRQQGQAAKA